ncbi:hypothetical protein [Aeromicrobium sp. 179-A 4D2 NHS]|uniref:hypothetical protein n=1 Tax=Aeromicrobium sp. 179-A 4D2 NHS TaxID=3142375 RepID=UPI0039A14444
MENPASWGPAEHAVSEVLRRWRENEAKPPLEQHIGHSLEMQITNALRREGLLVDVAPTGRIELTDPAPSPNGTPDV